VGNVAEPKMGMNRLAAPRTPPGGASGQRVRLWWFLRVVFLGGRRYFLRGFGLVDNVFLCRIGGDGHFSVRVHQGSFGGIIGYS